MTAIRKSRLFRGVAALLAMVLVAGMCALPATAANTDRISQVVFTKLEMTVNNNWFATFTYRNGAFVLQSQSNTIKIHKGDTIAYKVNWEIPQANMAGIEETDYFSIFLQNDSYIGFPATNAQDLKETESAGNDTVPIGVIGQWEVQNGAIKVVFNQNIKKRDYLKNGYFYASGSVTNSGTNVRITFGGQELFTTDIQQYPSGGVGPLGAQVPLGKSGRQMPNANKIVWTMDINNNSLEDFYKGYPASPPAALSDFVVTDRLQQGQTITNADINITVPVYFPYYNTANTSDQLNYKRLANRALEYLSITGKFTAIEDDGSYSSDADFKAYVISKAPAYGVYGGNYVVVAPGTLNDGDGANAIKIGNVIGGETGMDALITAFEVKYSDTLNPTQKAMVKAAYVDTANGFRGGLSNFNIRLVSDCTNVDTGDISNTLVSEYSGGGFQSVNTQTKFTYVGGGVQGGAFGRVTLTKTDRDDRNRAGRRGL